MLFQFHRAVRVVAEKIAVVWRLMQEKGEAGIGLMHVDKCLLRLQEGGTACAELDPQWRDCIRELKAAYDEASSLWQHEHRDGEKGLRALFSQIAQPGVGISNLDATTHHGLVVRLAGVLLEPRAKGIVPEHALDELRVGSLGRERDCDVIRLRVARELKPALWRTWATELELEYARVLPFVGGGEISQERQSGERTDATRHDAAEQQAEPSREHPVGEDGLGSPDWAPNAHQLLVLAVLKRDGRLRTGVLWERITPKRIDLRAHQNAMSDLVSHGRVKTAGKAQATEYWLP
jgi:hypothetical protein